MAWVHPWLIALEGEYSHKIDPYMVVCMLLYNGQFYACGYDLGISLAAWLLWRVQKIDPYNYSGMHAAI